MTGMSERNTLLGVAGTTASDRTQGAEAGVAPGGREDARPGDPSKVGDARTAWEGNNQPPAWRPPGQRNPAPPEAYLIRDPELRAAFVRAYTAWERAQRGKVAT